MTWHRTRRILRDTATPAEATDRCRRRRLRRRRELVGAGLVDAYAAVGAARG